MSQQKEEKKTVDLFLRNTSTTGQKKFVDVKFFVSMAYGKMLETQYEDDHVIILYVPNNKNAHINDLHGKVRLRLSPSTMDRMMGINSEDFTDFTESQLELFVKNYDHVVNAFKKISESYTINDDQFTGMTVFGQTLMKPVIAINKTEHMKTMTTHKVGYYVSERVKERIKNTLSGNWLSNNFILGVSQNHCHKRSDGKVCLGVLVGSYIDINDKKLGWTSVEKKCFVDNFNVIVEGFKDLKADMDSETDEFDTSDGIVF